MAEESEKPTPGKNDVEAFVSVFARHGVEYLVICGQAEMLMGGARVTFDTDFCYRRSRENLEPLANALKELNPTFRGAPADLPVTLDAQALALGNNYTLSTALGPVDLLGWVEPLGSYEELLPNSETYPVGKLSVRTIGLEDLIRVKQHLGRPKDRDSLLQLLAIRTIREEGTSS
jgi:hypothetical protein